ncbi:NAD(P)-dependent oxidoreductase [Streptomyces sp. NBC_00893]|uniref:NAD-dependent epimerase/dehydratase family protein n=1 Tax=Streptomyces sp. NBC_00893 TaxID=2975862 RepID=UPI00224C8C5D|nr:NAD-dependent epimerase/dehydratase family protein [Streptomyces sp. NBC_00893]MCX4850446.1 NAD-dependent epimerase/dehydratase family protein [Streptomyces sp. NBC_00893]
MPEIKQGKKPTVLVTGGAGFIGRHLTAALRSAGMTVHSVDDLRVRPLADPDGSLVRKSVRELTPNDVSGVDVVYHLASDKSVPLSFVQPLQYLDNLESTAHLMRVCADAAVPRVLIASTCEVYGRAARLPTEESAPLAPLSPYAASKVAMEMVARTYQECADSGMDTTIVRFFNVYGPGERPDAVIPGFCLGALTDGSLCVEGAGTQRRDFSYIDDVVDQLVQLTAAAPVPVVNIGSGVSASVLEIAAIVRELCPNATVRWTRSRPNEIPEFRSDVSLQRSLFSLRTPSVGLREGVERTLRWWSESGVLERHGSPAGSLLRPQLIG